MPARTQITRHDCVEGWSCIAKWKGPQLSAILDEVKPKPEARFVVFHCFDSLGADETRGNAGNITDDSDTADTEGSTLKPRYYESIDLNDARHPQTILAYEMNDTPLPVAHGAPLRLRV
jgi:DMSO/TMAO reductase YedYZ molybdopterin-dependent catalytic subunit